MGEAVQVVVAIAAAALGTLSVLWVLYGYSAAVLLVAPMVCSMWAPQWWVCMNGKCEHGLHGGRDG